MRYAATRVVDIKSRQWYRLSFSALLIMATLTGIGQMPVFKRYYIADIPGLGWLGQFYVIHFVHYLFGALLLALIGYIVVDWMLRSSNHLRLSTLGKGRALVLGGILLTGIMLSLKNFTLYLYPQFVIVALDFIHLGLVMIWLALSLFAMFKRQGWIDQKSLT
jgi:hypothetical protein